MPPKSPNLSEDEIHRQNVERQQELLKKNAELSRQRMSAQVQMPKEIRVRPRGMSGRMIAGEQGANEKPEVKYNKETGTFDVVKDK